MDLYVIKIHGTKYFYGSKDRKTWYIPDWTQKKGFFWTETVIVRERTKTAKKVEIQDLLMNYLK